jgi:hypothetical protein
MVGDTHADWGALEVLIDMEKPELILQCGDFGYWPRLADVPQPPDTSNWPRIHFCDGNHEDHDALAQRESDEVLPNVVYQPRGSTLTLPDGRVVLFLGGATSIDKAARVMGRDWFPQEVPGYEVFEALDGVGRVDIVVSHTCPQEFEMSSGRSGEDVRFRDPTRDLLSYVLDNYRPAQWFFGHWHVRRSGDAMGCHWTALAHTAGRGWWTALR